MRLLAPAKSPLFSFLPASRHTPGDYSQSRSAIVKIVSFPFNIEQISCHCPKSVRLFLPFWTKWVPKREWIDDENRRRKETSPASRSAEVLASFFARQMPEGSLDFVPGGRIGDHGGYRDCDIVIQGRLWCPVLKCHTPTGRAQGRGYAFALRTPVRPFRL
jgi:hypothetical protein